MLILILGICRGHLPNSIIKNIYIITSFLNNTASNLTNKLAIDAKLSLANRISLKLYI
jgi:hypothetical protein